LSSANRGFFEKLCSWHSENNIFCFISISTLRFALVSALIQAVHFVALSAFQ
jgi:hypothetical protein